MPQDSQTAVRRLGRLRPANRGLARQWCSAGPLAHGVSELSFACFGGQASCMCRQETLSMVSPAARAFAEIWPDAAAARRFAELRPAYLKLVLQASGDGEPGSALALGAQRLAAETAPCIGQKTNRRHRVEAACTHGQHPCARALAEWTVALKGCHASQLTRSIRVECLRRSDSPACLALPAAPGPRAGVPRGLADSCLASSFPCASGSLIGAHIVNAPAAARCSSLGCRRTAARRR